MTFVSLHNGGGTGIGRSLHCGFALLLDGSERVDAIIKNAIVWDVLGGVARRAWARNPHAMEVALEHNIHSDDAITLPWLAAPALIEKTLDAALPDGKQHVPGRGA